MGSYFPHNHALALTELDAILAEHPNAEGMDAVLYYRARCLEVLGKPDGEINQAYEQLAARFPGSDFLLLVGKHGRLPRLFHQRGYSPAVAPERRQFLEALDLYDRGYYQEAAGALSDFSDAWPDSANLAEVLYWRARCHHKLRHYHNAIALYRELIERFPESEQMIKAFKHLGFLTQHHGEPPQAYAWARKSVSLYQRWLADHPDHPDFGWVLIVLGETYAMIEPEKAEACFQQAATLDPKYRIWNGQSAAEYIPATPSPLGVTTVFTVR